MITQQAVVLRRNSNSKWLGLLALLFLTGCSFFIEPKPVIENAPIEEQLILDELDAFKWQWRLAFDTDITSQLDSVHIIFKPKTEEEWFTKGCVRGLTDPYNYSYIQVAYRSDKDFKISQTAFYHELVHLTLGQLVGEGDINHSQPPGPWTTDHDQLIERLKRLARIRDM